MIMATYAPPPPPTYLINQTAGLTCHALFLGIQHSLFDCYLIAGHGLIPKMLFDHVEFYIGIDLCVFLDAAKDYPRDGG